jgi:signal transduction histidine kinase/ActR/RegA family two-component response regulator
MANVNDFGLAFPQDYLRAALMVSLLSVWVLVGLFFYLNRFTRREYFTIWTAAWLFYALWLTLCLRMGKVEPGSVIFMVKQCCVSISAVFLLWGSLRFLGLPVRQTSFGVFMLFLVVWTFVSPMVSPNLLQIQLPIFIMLGLSSLFAGACFFHLRRKKSFVGAGMLSLGFLFWGLYLATYPLTEQYPNLYSDGFFVAAALQLFIAVSMIVLVLEEVRQHAEQVRAEIAAVRLEKEALQAKVLTAKEECQTLYEQMRLTEGAQEAYEELRRTQQAVVQQERLRALGQMASGIAHDINNAMCPITAYSELLLASLPDLDEESKKQLHRISQAACDITEIVAHMREIYRRDQDPGKLALINVNKAVQDVVELTRPRWRDQAQREGRSIHVQCQLEPEAPMLLCDASELREALTNIVFNAVDALPAGGDIAIITRAVTRPVPEASANPARELQLEVRDNGTGMDEKVRQRCLEPFFSTKTQRGGSGLGLAMVYGMVQRQQGNIEIESAPDQGTCVRLILPMLQPALPVPQPKAAGVPPCRSVRVLCIDDEPGVRELLHICLENNHHRVSVAPSGKEGLEMFRASLHDGQPFQVVITDLGMPDMDGYHVARAIKAESPRTPILMLTGWGSMIKADGEAVPAVDAIMSKPPQMRELNTLLQRLAANSV